MASWRSRVRKPSVLFNTNTALLSCIINLCWFRPLEEGSLLLHPSGNFSAFSKGEMAKTSIWQKQIRTMGEKRWKLSSYSPEMSLRLWIWSSLQQAYVHVWYLRQSIIGIVRRWVRGAVAQTQPFPLSFLPQLPPSIAEDRTKFSLSCNSAHE